MLMMMMVVLSKLHRVLSVAWWEEKLGMVLNMF